MAIVNNEMMNLGKAPSVIRNIFEYGNKRAKEIGRENVFDFSLGNPSIPAPKIVDDTIIDLINNLDSVQLHGYTSAVGDENVRALIAEDINKRFNAGVDKTDIYMTCGAAASLTISLKALCCPGDEFIAIAPFFPEYKVFIEGAGGKFVKVDADLNKFQINFDSLEKALTKNTKGIIVNSPNNPTGVIFTKETLAKLCDILREKEKEYGHAIYLICDEPYRELVYDNNLEVPYLINMYNDTIVCYSFSKSLSLPGERIGYIVVSNKIEGNRDLYAAVCGAGRSQGYVCAPSMMQKVIAKSLGNTSDISKYMENRDLLFNSLTKFGFTCIHPDGAFYLFMKSPEKDATAFCEKAKKYELLLVPSDSFGCEGFVRISYCVSNEMIKKSLPSFEKLAKEYNL